MLELARSVRFCITPAVDPDRERAGPAHNTYAGWPTMIGLGVYYVWMAVVQSRVMVMGSVITAILSIGLFAMGGATLRALWIRRNEALRRLEPEAAAAPSS